jgi:hypothetical protein
LGRLNESINQSIHLPQPKLSLFLAKIKSIGRTPGTRTS